MAKQGGVFVLSQHNLGMGHLTRASAIAEAVLERGIGKVCLFSGGPSIDEYAPPTGVEFTQLPPIRRLRTGESKVGPVERGRSLEEVVAERVAILVRHLQRTPPRAVVIEHYPFSPHHFAGTIEPFLEACGEIDPRPVVISSIRDAPIGCLMPDLNAVARMSNDRLRNHFSIVLHHTDPRAFPGEEITGFEESVRGVPVEATGYVRRSSPRGGKKEPAPEGILLTAGGGRDGAENLAALLAGAARAKASWIRPVRVVCGPLMPEKGRRLVRESARAAGAEVHDALGSLDGLIQQSRAVAGMGGYNSVVEALGLGKPMLVLPRSWSYEQRARIGAFAERNIVLSMGEERSDPDRVAGRLEELSRFRPSFLPDTNGARRSAEIIEALIEGRAIPGSIPANDGDDRRSPGGEDRVG